jgi:hypothetical protein
MPEMGQTCAVSILLSMIERGEFIEILRRALRPEALPELLRMIHRRTRHGREIASLFREGDAEDALAMKRADGHARLLGDDRDQVVAQIADLYVARPDVLLGSGSRGDVTISPPTNDDVAEISRAIRRRLQETRRDRDRRSRVPGHRSARAGIRPGARRRRPRVALRRTWGVIEGREQQIGNNGDVVEALSRDRDGLRIRTHDGRLADVEWRRLADPDAGPKACRRLRATAVNDTLARHLKAIDAAMMENEALTGDISRNREVAAQLAARRHQAAEAAGTLREAKAEPALPRLFAGPSA